MIVRLIYSILEAHQTPPKDLTVLFLYLFRISMFLLGLPGAFH